MYRSLLIPYLFFLLLLSGVDAFGKPHRHKNRQRRVHVFYNPLTDSNASCVDPHCSCGSVGFGIVQKIPYLPHSSPCAPVDIRFSSACVRCGLCLAVSDQINQTLIDTHDTMAPNYWLNDTEAAFLLKAVCDHSFRHFSLRETQGKRYICDRTPGATLVTSTADGLWEKNLKDKCNQYLAAIGSTALYKHWQKWCGLGERNCDIATILCRGDVGIFRDCKSIPNVVKPEVKARQHQAKMKVMVEFKCR